MNDLYEVHNKVTGEVSPVVGMEVTKGVAYVAPQEAVEAVEATETTPAVEAKPAVAEVQAVLPKIWVRIPTTHIVFNNEITDEVIQNEDYKLVKKDAPVVAEGEAKSE